MIAYYPKLTYLEFERSDPWSQASHTGFMDLKAFRCCGLRAIHATQRARSRSVRLAFPLCAWMAVIHAAAFSVSAALRRSAALVMSISSGEISLVSPSAAPGNPSREHTGRGICVLEALASRFRLGVLQRNDAGFVYSLMGQVECRAKL